MITNKACRCSKSRCSELARRYRSGDASAGNELAIAFGPLVRGIVARVLGPNRKMEWEDAAQMAFLQSLLAISKWKEDCPYCCYLAVVVAKRCIDVVRSLDSDRHVPLMGDQEIVDRQNQDTDPEFVDRYEIALNSLSAEYCKVWNQYLDDIPVSEIACQSGVSERTIYYRLDLVKAVLARALREFGENSSRSGISLQGAPRRSSVIGEVEK